MGGVFCFFLKFPPKCAWSWWAAVKTSPLCLLFNGALPGAEPRQSRPQITPSFNSTGRSTQHSVHNDHQSPRLQSTLTLHRVNDLQWKRRNRKSNAIESVIGHVTVDIWPSYSGKTWITCTENQSFQSNEAFVFAATHVSFGEQSQFDLSLTQIGRAHPPSSAGRTVCGRLTLVQVSRCHRLLGSITLRYCGSS